MTKELSSGIFYSLRALCGGCSRPIAEHAYCALCGRPRRCDDEIGWVYDAGEPDKARCPTCEFAAAV